MKSQFLILKSVFFLQTLLINNCVNSILACCMSSFEIPISRNCELRDIIFPVAFAFAMNRHVTPSKSVFFLHYTLINDNCWNSVLCQASNPVGHNLEFFFINLIKLAKIAKIAMRSTFENNE